MVTIVVRLNRTLTGVCLGLLCSSGIATDVAEFKLCTVIAHRGASGYFPEHTLEAYQLAMEQGADYIEPDLVMTKDGVPIARHEARLELTTDIADRPEFAARRSARYMRGEEVAGWFSDDFTLKEIRTLRAKERYPEIRQANTEWDGQFAIPTLQDVIDLVRAYTEKTGKDVGIYPELKTPNYFADRKLDITGVVLATLSRNGLDGSTDQVIIQSFDAEALKRAHAMSNLPLVQLLGEQEPEAIARQVTPMALEAMAKYATGIGVYKYGYILIDDPSAQPLPYRNTGLVTAAHDAGLDVHVYTFRAENKFLAESFRGAGGDAAKGNLRGELSAFIAAGVDGIFIDHPDIGVAACKREARM